MTGSIRIILHSPEGISTPGASRWSGRAANDIFIGTSSPAGEQSITQHLSRDEALEQPEHWPENSAL